MVMSSLIASKKVLRALSRSLGGFQVLLLWKEVSCSLAVWVWSQHPRRNLLILLPLSRYFIIFSPYTYLLFTLSIIFTYFRFYQNL